MSSAAYDLLQLLNDVARLTRTEADKRAREHGMTRAQWVILSRLKGFPGLSQRELAEILEVEPITVGRLVDRLERRGLVERRPDAVDRRIWRLHLRAEAAPVLAALDVQRDIISEIVNEGLSDEDLEQTARALLRMKTNIGACRRAPPTGDLQEIA